jgi:hypothetical protein
MEALDLVYAEGKSGDYVFKHALSRDALYQSLLTGPRVTLHLKVAEEIERRAANRLAEVAETLAHLWADGSSGQGLHLHGDVGCQEPGCLFA